MATDVSERFAAAAMRHGELRSGSDANEAVRQIVSAYHEMRSQPDGGRAILTALQADPDPSVALWAASFLVHDVPETALATLEKIARGGHRHISFSAKMTLQEWAAGRLKRPEDW